MEINQIETKQLIERERWEWKYGILRGSFMENEHWEEEIMVTNLRKIILTWGSPLCSNGPHRTHNFDKINQNYGSCTKIL